MTAIAEHCISMDNQMVQHKQTFRMIMRAISMRYFKKKLKVLSQLGGHIGSFKEPAEESNVPRKSRHSCMANHL